MNVNIFNFRTKKFMQNGHRQGQGRAWDTKTDSSRLQGDHFVFLFKNYINSHGTMNLNWCFSSTQITWSMNKDIKCSRVNENYRQYLITRIQEWRIKAPPLTDQIILTPAGGFLSYWPMFSSPCGGRMSQPKPLAPAGGSPAT